MSSHVVASTGNPAIRAAAPPRSGAVSTLNVALAAFLTCAGAPPPSQQAPPAVSQPKGRETAAETLGTLERYGVKTRPELADRVARLAAVNFPPTGTAALIGSGFNSVTAETRGRCVKVGPLATVAGNRGQGTGQSVEFTLEEVTDLRSLRRQLGVNASGSFRHGVYRGDAKASYLTNSTFNRFSSYMFVRTSVINQVESLQEYVLEETWRTKLVQDPTAFLQGCGDYFVVGVQTGGEFLAIVEFASETQAQQDAVSAAIRASGAQWNAAADVKAIAERLSASTETKIRLFRQGDDSPVPDVASLLTYAQSFPSKVTATSGKAWPVTALTLDYATVSNLPSARLPDLVASMRVLSELADRRDTAVALRNDVKYAHDHPDQFVAPDDAKLEAALSSLDAIVKQTEDAASTCHDDHARCGLPPVTFPEVPDLVRKPPADHFVTDVRVVKGRNLACPEGYEGLRFGQAARPRQGAAGVDDVNKGMGGDIVGICVKFTPAAEAARGPVLTGIEVKPWPDWQPGCQDGWQPTGTLTTRTRGPCNRMGLCARYGSLEPSAPPHAPPPRALLSVGLSSHGDGSCPPGAPWRRGENIQTRKAGCGGSRLFVCGDVQ